MTHIRSLSTEWTLSEDGRNVRGRIFPFGEVAHIREVNNGEVDIYDEEFLPGCTHRMRQVAMARGGAPSWIRFTVDHEQSFDARLGFCTGLEEADDGAFGGFRLYDGPQLPKIRSMLAESHQGLSIEFDDVVDPIVSGSLRQRRQINIGAVTATPIPIYEGARVLAVRANDDALEAAGTPNLDQVRAMLAETTT